MSAAPAKHYVVVRPDLPLGLLCAQVVHAAGESAALRAPPDGCHAVVVTASVEEIQRLARVLPKKGIRVRLIVENTPPYEGAVMALGVEPIPPEKGRWFGHLPLLRGPRGEVSV